MRSRRLFVWPGSWSLLPLSRFQPVPLSHGHGPANNVSQPEASDEGGPAHNCECDNGPDAQRPETALVTPGRIAASKRKQGVGRDCDNGQDYDGSDYTFPNRHERTLLETRKGPTCQVGLEMTVTWS